MPTPDALKRVLRRQPGHPLAPAPRDLLQTLLVHRLPGGTVKVAHPWKQTSIVAAAFRLKVPLTVHPGIGYDIFSNHRCSTAPRSAGPGRPISGCWAPRLKGSIPASCFPWISHHGAPGLREESQLRQQPPAAAKSQDRA